MFEKYEKWTILAIIAIAAYYFWKKGKSIQGQQPEMSVPDIFGSIVNQLHEPSNVQPAQSTRPVVFAPAQPSTVPTSVKVGVPSTWYPAPPVLRPVIPVRTFTLNSNLRTVRMA